MIEYSDSGIQLDLVRTAFKGTKYGFSFVHIPFGRGALGFQQFNADGVLTLPESFKAPAMYLSQPYIEYQNVAVSLVDNNFTIKQLSDLSGKSVTAFQKAELYLGKEYQQAVEATSHYREIPEQKKQIELLFLNRTDVIVLDINILKYYLKNYVNREIAKPFTVHFIFDKSPYSLGFRSEAMRDVFDQNIKKMKENGTYQVIVDKYL